MRHPLKVWRDPGDRISVLRIVTLMCLFAPLSKAIYDSDAIRLDARPITELIHRTGDWALIFLLVALAVRPLSHRLDSAVPLGKQATPLSSQATASPSMMQQRTRGCQRLDDQREAAGGDRERHGLFRARPLQAVGSACPSARISIPQVIRCFMMPRAKFITNTSHLLPTDG